MRINWKLLAGFSLFGAAISLISGLAGGNPFGIILLRLVLSAVVFAALGLGVQAVLRRYLPDLLHSAPRSEAVAGDSVDIIIDDELPVSGETDGRGRPGGGGEAVGGSREVEETLTEPEEVRAEAESPKTRPETEEEAGLGLEPPSGPEETEEGSASEAGFQSVEFPELEDESSAGARFDGGANAGASGDSRPSPAAAVPAREELEAVTDLEVLPDMDSLEEGEDPESREELGESGPIDAGPSTRRAPSTPREMRQAQIEETVKDQDPENLARAVRTFLKKDQ